MSTVTLPYWASRSWMEQEILSGRPLESREHAMVVELNELDDDVLRKRIETARNAFVRLTAGPIIVFDSGLNPNRSFADGPEEPLERMDAAVVAAIGDLPEIAEPTDDAELVVAAWEAWLDAYVEMSLSAIDDLIDWSPSYEERTWGSGGGPGWGSVALVDERGGSLLVDPEDGSVAIRDALAVQLRDIWASYLFDEVSVAAARQATAGSQLAAQAEMGERSTAEIARDANELSRRVYAIARAHYEARRLAAPSFEDEMRGWAAKWGSERLQLGLADGYRMNARYIAERVAAEVPGFYAVPVNEVGAGWAAKAASPSREALRLRRLVAKAVEERAPKTLAGDPEVEIMVVRQPPHQIYRPDKNHPDYPSRGGWPWDYVPGGVAQTAPPRPFEAVVVRNWLGRFHLIGAVMDADGDGPPGIWAVPDPAHFGDDGSVASQDPDGPEPPQARRKPPLPQRSDDDIPF